MMRSDTQSIAYVDISGKTTRIAYNGSAIHALLIEAYANAAAEATSEPKVVWEPILKNIELESPA